MPEYRFVQEGEQLCCYVRGKKHLVLDISGVRFLVPMSIANNERLCQSLKQLLTEQTALYKQLLENGVPLEDATKALAISSLFSIEFGEGKLGDLLQIVGPEGE